MSAQMAGSLFTQVSWQLQKKSYGALSKQIFCSHNILRSVLAPFSMSLVHFPASRLRRLWREPGCLGWNFRSTSYQLWDAGGVMEASSPFLSSPVTCSHQQNGPSGFLSKLPELMATQSSELCPARGPSVRCDCNSQLLSSVECTAFICGFVDSFKDSTTLYRLAVQ